ncbi:MAG: hypothetical protein FJX65_19565 [Alphaproteobacteria bacterium]|nr:hypothetical protein [Alphaproteobacteria bacterium]
MLHKPTGKTRPAHRSYRGKILYIGDTLGERGREWFTVTVQEDGTRTLRAHCEIDDAEINHTRVLRDVIYTLDKQWRPLDSYVRITVNKAFMGSAWFRFSEHLVECEGYSVGEGRFSQRVETERWVRVFAPHPVICDVWHMAGWDWKNPAKTQTWPTIMSSPLPNGASGPLIGVVDFATRYHGKERVTVPAGTFDCEHFSFPLEDRPGSTPEHLWYSGPDMDFVKIRWDFAKTTYELVELQKE